MSTPDPLSPCVVATEVLWVAQAPVPCRPRPAGVAAQSHRRPL